MNLVAISRASRLAVLAGGLLLCAAVSQGQQISPSDCTVPQVVTGVGSVGGVPAAMLGEFVIVLRAGTPLPGREVICDLAMASTDFIFNLDDLGVGITAECRSGYPQLHGRTGPDGSVRFLLRAAARPGAGTPSNLSKVQFYGQNLDPAGNFFVRIGEASVAVYDLDGIAGVGANDLSLWLADFGSIAGPLRSDYDHSGSLGANDLSLWLQVFGAGIMTDEFLNSCP